MRPCPPDGLPIMGEVSDGSMGWTETLNCRHGKRVLNETALCFRVHLPYRRTKRTPVTYSNPLNPASANKDGTGMAHHTSQLTKLNG